MLVLISGCSGRSAIEVSSSSAQNLNSEAKPQNVNISDKLQDADEPVSTDSSSGNIDAVTSPDRTKLPLSDKLILVNKWQPLPDSYIPDNLVRVCDKNNIPAIPTKDKSAMLDAEALAAAVKMFEGAAADGINDLVLSSGYRSYQLQTIFFNNKVKQFSSSLKMTDAMEKAKTVVAFPGTSEHHTGLAMDLTTVELSKLKDPLVESFGKTPAGKWLYANSWKYGYVIRYAEEKTSLTGVISEPWHLRYVGLPHSEIMYKNNMCLEEYISSLKQ